MVINNLRDLNKIMQVCRKNGVTALKIDNIEFTIEAAPAPVKRPKTTAITDTFDPGVIPPPERIQTPDELTAEQLLMWSATGEQPVNG